MTARDVIVCLDRADGDRFRRLNPSLRLQSTDIVSRRVLRPRLAGRSVRDAYVTTAMAASGHWQDAYQRLSHCHWKTDERNRGALYIGDTPEERVEATTVGRSEWLPLRESRPA